MGALRHLERAESVPTKRYRRTYAMAIRTEVVELAHTAKKAELAYWDEFEKIYGGWTIEWDPQSDARLEGLAAKMREADEAFWQAKSELDPGDQTADPNRLNDSGAPV